MPLEIGLFISLIKFRYFSFLRTALLLRLDSKPAVNCRTYGHFDDDDDYYYYYYYQVFLNANYVFVSIISMHRKRKEVCLKTRSTSASRPVKGWDTKPTTLMVHQHHLGS